jgi:predicted nuclease with TOPRIM domain
LLVFWHSFRHSAKKSKIQHQPFEKFSTLKSSTMANTNYPSSSPQPSSTPNNNNNTTRNVLIGLLAAGLLGTWGYVLYDKNKTEQTIQVKSAEVSTVTEARDSVQNIYNDALNRLDSLVGYNNSLTGQLSDRQSEISRLRSQISALSKKSNLTESERRKLKSLMAQATAKINMLENEVARLMGENQTLAANNTVLTNEKVRLTTDLQSTTQQKEELAQKVDVGSTFSASNFAIKGIDEKGNGKEKETDKAKKVNKLVVSFDVENRIAQSGPADIYVVVTGPDGQVITNPAAGSGVLTTRNDGEKTFTTKSSIEYEQGTRKNISFPLRQDKFQTGDYKIEVYHNGLKIAEGTRNLRKSGFLGL